MRKIPRTAKKLEENPAGPIWQSVEFLNSILFKLDWYVVSHYIMTHSAQNPVLEIVQITGYTLVTSFGFHHGNTISVVALFQEYFSYRHDKGRTMIMCKVEQHKSIKGKVPSKGRRL